MNGTWGNEVIKDYEGNTLIYIGKMKNAGQVEDVLACSMISDGMDEKRKERIISAARVFTASHELLEVVETFLSNYEGLKKVNNPEDSYALEVWGKLATAARAAISNF